MAYWDISTAGASLEFDTQNYTGGDTAWIDDTHLLLTYRGHNTDAWATVLEVNTSTGVVTEAGTKFNYDVNWIYGGVLNVGTDPNHFISFWTDDGSDGKAVILEVNTTTWAVTTANSEFQYFGFAKWGDATTTIDDNHFLVTYADAQSDGRADVLEVNTSTWAISTNSTLFEFDTQLAQGQMLTAIDGYPSKAIIAYRGTTSVGNAVILDVNTTTYAVTLAGARFEFNAGAVWGERTAIGQIDDNHFFIAYYVSGEGFAQVLSVNTSTWAVTTATAPYQFSTTSTTDINMVAIDSATYQLAYEEAGDGVTEVMGVDASTYAISQLTGTRFEYQATPHADGIIAKIDRDNTIITWSSTDNDGFTQMFLTNASPLPLEPSDTTVLWDVTTANSSLEYDTAKATWTSAKAVDENHFINVWQTGTNRSLLQVFEVNTTTWAVTTAGAILDLTIEGSANDIIPIPGDPNHFFLSYEDRIDDDGFAQIVEVNTTTWAVTTSAALFEFAAANGEGPRTVPVDDNHFLIVYRNSGNDGVSEVLEVNTTTWVITTTDGSFIFDYQQGYNLRIINIPDFQNKALVVYKGGSFGYGTAIVLDVNTSTWEVTAAVSRFTFSAEAAREDPDIRAVDANHFFFSAEGLAYVLAVNTTTWAITTASAAFEYDALSASVSAGIASMDANHFAVPYRKNSGEGLVQVLAVDTTTYEITTTSDAILEFDTDVINQVDPERIDDSHFIAFWTGTSSDGFVQVFTVTTSEASLPFANAPYFGINF